MTAPNALKLAYAIRWGVIAGAAGGLAEIFWVLLYAAASGLEAASVARGVTIAVGAQALLPNAAATTGIAIHMALALALGIALAWIAQAFPTGRIGHYAYLLPLGAVTGVWAMNFFVLLPIISPDFVHLVPYSVSLVSKLLFGLAAAAVLRHFAPAANCQKTPTAIRRPF